MQDSHHQSSSIHGARLICCVRGAGGQGTALISAMLALMRRQDDSQFGAIAASVGVSSKLRSMISNVTDLADLPAMTSEPGAPYLYARYWDPLGTALVDADDQSATLVAVGANLAKPLLEWAELSGLSEIAPPKSIDLVVVVTADPTSLSRAHALIQAATRPHVLPLRSVVTLANEWPRSFDDTYRADDTFAAIAEAGRSYGPGILTIPRCTSTLLRMVECGRIKLNDLISSDHATIAHTVCVPVVTASRELRAFQTWAAACRATFAHAGLLAPPPSLTPSIRQAGKLTKGSEID